MAALIWGLYAGLILFSILGLQALSLRSRIQELRAQEDRIRRLLMRVKLRNGRL